MRTLVILMGRCNVGKTTTLRKLQKLLKDDGFKVCQKSRSNCSYLFREQSESVVIGMDGDSGDNIRNNFSAFEEYKATVCITATRTFGLCSEESLRNELSKYLKDFKQVVYIIKRAVSEHEQSKVNQSVAEKIYGGIKLVMKGKKFTIRNAQEATVITEL